MGPKALVQCSTQQNAGRPTCREPHTGEAPGRWLAGLNKDQSETVFSYSTEKAVERKRRELEAFKCDPPRVAS